MSEKEAEPEEGKQGSLVPFERPAHQKESPLSSLGSAAPVSPFSQNTSDPPIAVAGPMSNDNTEPPTHFKSFHRRSIKKGQFAPDGATETLAAKNSAGVPEEATSKADKGVSDLGAHVAALKAVEANLHRAHHVHEDVKPHNLILVNPGPLPPPTQPSRGTPATDDPYSFLRTFDTVFLIDDSSSMAGWSLSSFNYFAPTTPPKRNINRVAGAQGTFKRELQVPGSFGGIPVSATPDLGSSFNIVSENFVRTHNLPLETQECWTYSLPNGRVRSFIGTVTGNWQFDSDAKTHEQTFHVLKDCVFPVLLGRPFLTVTKTFSQFKNRIKEVVTRGTSALQRLCFVDNFDAASPSAERLLGLINGHPVPGFTDSCSDISVIKRSVAQLLGLDILEGPDYTTEVQFVDGSTAFTTGMVKGVDWCFGVTAAGADTRRLDFHIMDDIPCAVILDKWLLWDNDVFNTYGDCMMSVEECHTSRHNPVCVLQEVKRHKQQFAAVDPRDKEADRRAEEDDRIDCLPLGEQAAARETEDRRRREWDERQRGDPGATRRPLPVLSLPAAIDSTSISTSVSRDRSSIASTSSPARLVTDAEIPHSPPLSEGRGFTPSFKKLKASIKSQLGSRQHKVSGESGRRQVP